MTNRAGRHRLRIVGSLTALSLVVVGCGSSSTDAACISAGAAEICATGGQALVRLDARGLQPGSELSIDAALGEPMILTVTDGGTLAGSAGIATPRSGTMVTVTIAGTTDAGEPISGVITVSS